MSKATVADVKAYCDKFDLTFMTLEELEEQDGKDEWPDVVCAGVFIGAVALVLTVHGNCRVVERWADGIRLMEDRWMNVSGERLQSAVILGIPLHPEE